MPGKPKGLPKTGGRQKGTGNKATADIQALAQQYCPAAVAELGRLAQHALSEQAKVAAIKELIDRGYGKSAQVIAGDKNNPVALEIRWRSGNS